MSHTLGPAEQKPNPQHSSLLGGKESRDEWRGYPGNLTLQQMFNSTLGKQHGDSNDLPDIFLK